MKNKITHSEKKLYLQKAVRKAWLQCKEVKNTKTVRDIKISN